nr:hypothetical protein [Xanthomonas phaseoli]
MLQVRPCKLRGGIHAAKGPATVGGQGPVEMVGAHGSAKQPAEGFALFLRFHQNHPPTVWCGVAADCGTVGGMDAAIEPPWTG